MAKGAMTRTRLVLACVSGLLLACGGGGSAGSSRLTGAEPAPAPAPGPVPPAPVPPPSRDLAICGGGSAAVQAAFSAVLSGGSINVTCATDLDGNVSLSNKNNVTLRFTDSGSFRATADGGQTIPGFGKVLWLISNCGNCDVEVKYDGNGRAAAIGLTGNDGLTLRGGYIKNVGTDSNIGVRDFDPSSASAALVATGNRNGKYLDILLEDTATWHRADGSFNGARGAWIGNGATEQIEHNPTVTGWTVRRAGHTGIAMHPSGGYIARNTVVGNGCAGMKITPNSGGPTVVVEDIETRDNICQGIQVEQIMPGSGGVILRRIRSSGNGQSMVYSGEGVINGLQILDSESVGDKGRSAIITHGGQDLTIRANRFRDQQGALQLIGDHQNVRFTCNTLENLSRDVIVTTGTQSEVQNAGNTLLNVTTPVQGSFPANGATSCQ